MHDTRLFVFLLGAVVVIGAATGCTESASTGRPPVGSPPADEIRDGPVFDVQSVTLDARRKPDSTLLVHLRDLGVTHVTLVPFGWQAAVDEPHIRVDTADGWYSESHRGIRTLSRQADALGMAVILKPHIWIGRYDEGGNRSEIQFESDAAWTRWARDYRDFMLEYAMLAAEVDAAILVIGTELSQVATRRPSFWRGLADTVRTVYGGQLTYAANWHREYRDIRFWESMDYVGVQAYFPLSETPSPSVDTLEQTWRSHRKTLAALHERTGRPVLFTEIGYRSARSAAAKPWRWPERGGDVPPDSALQARCYSAFLSTMGMVDWFEGAIVWKWHPRRGERGATDFTPQGKPAERVLYRWFTGTAPQVPLRSSIANLRNAEPAVGGGLALRDRAGDGRDRE